MLYMSVPSTGRCLATGDCSPRSLSVNPPRPQTTAAPAPSVSVLPGPHRHMCACIAINQQADAKGRTTTMCVRAGSVSEPERQVTLRTGTPHMYT